MFLSLETEINFLIEEKAFSLHYTSDLLNWSVLSGGLCRAHVCDPLDAEIEAVSSQDHLDRTAEIPPC